MGFFGQPDSNLIDKHNSMLTERKEKERIEKELLRRGYIRKDGMWYQETNHTDSSLELGSLIRLGILLFLILFPIMAPFMLGEGIYGLFKVLSQEVLYIPNNHPPSFSKETIMDKLTLVGGLFVIGCGFGLIPITTQFITKGKFKAIFLGLPLALILGSSSTLFAFYEIKERNDITLLDISLFAAVFLLSLMIGMKARSFLRRGIYISLITIIGFISAGYGLISPYILLLVCGYTMMFIIKK
jgi:hypothetical protein